MYRRDLPSTQGLTGASFPPTAIQSTRKEGKEWTRKEEKEFEAALVFLPENAPDRWNLVAERLGKSAAEVRNRYDALVQELADIEAGRVELPSYSDDLEEVEDDHARAQPIGVQISSLDGKRPREPERKKGTPWTEEEHRLFLIGLDRYGKGDWRSISRNVVLTRTPTQVASHAQKFFIRLNSRKKDRKRQSIHDIKTVDVNCVSLPIDQNWIAPPATPPVQQPQMPIDQNWIAPLATPPVQQPQMSIDQNLVATPATLPILPLHLIQQVQPANQLPNQVQQQQQVQHANQLPSQVQQLQVIQQQANQLPQINVYSSSFCSKYLI